MKNNFENSNIEAEMSLLGACLIDMDAFYRIRDLLIPKHFYKEKHRKIFKAMQQLVEDEVDLPIDMVSLSEQLKKNKVYDKVGGGGYIQELVMAVPTSAHILHYAKIIMNHWKKRKGGKK